MARIAAQLERRERDPSGSSSTARHRRRTSGSQSRYRVEVSARRGTGERVTAGEKRGHLRLPSAAQSGAPVKRTALTCVSCSLAQMFAERQYGTLCWSGECLLVCLIRLHSPFFRFICFLCSFVVAVRAARLLFHGFKWCLGSANMAHAADGPCKCWCSQIGRLKAIISKCVGLGSLLFVSFRSLDFLVCFSFCGCLP